MIGDRYGERPLRHWRRAAAALVALLTAATPVGSAAVVSVGVVSAGVGAAGVGAAGEGGDRAGSVRPVAQAPDSGSAHLAARRQGSRVEVADLRTPSRVVYAEPDGTMTAELDSRPVRVQRPDGTWTPVNTFLARRSDGTVGPVATTTVLEFSGGGALTPMVRYGAAAGWVELWWPGSLPAPVLSGDTAMYADVLPGVDLRLRADAEGYGQFFVVRDRAAAQQPAMRELSLGVRTGGGATMHSTSDGALELRDAAGAVVAAAPVSRMWDSGTPARESTVGVTVEGQDLVLRPDPGLLAGPDTTYPVTVDPQWHTADKHRWTSVLSGKPNTPYPNSSGAPPLAQVGQCYQASGECNGIGEAWTYWMFDTSFLAGRLMLSATMRMVVVHSPDCDSTPRGNELWKAAAAINDGTTWNNRPGTTGPLLSRFAAPKVNADWGCPGNKEVGIRVDSAVNLGGTTTFLVKPWDSGDQRAWRKYDNNAKLQVNFNRPPNPPYGLTTDPPLPAACRWCGGVPYIGDDNVLLKANLSDPDGDQVRPTWSVDISGTRTEYPGGYLNSGSTHSRNVATGGLHDKSVSWAVKADDTAHWADWVSGPGFRVDRVAPPVKPTVQGVLYQQDNRWHGGVGVPDRFTFWSHGFDANGNRVDVTDIDHFLYGWSDPPSSKVDADALGGKAAVTLTPPGDGPQDLFVRGVDRAGHQSPTQVYHFYVRAGSGPLAQWSLDGNGNDDAFLGDRQAAIVGPAAFVPGAVGQAIKLDGTSTYLSAPAAVRTDASFSVSAWVKLDSAGYARAVVSQDGVNFSGFVLWYRPDNGGHWVFGMARSKDVYQGTDLAVSAQPAQVGVWTHLTGVFCAFASGSTGPCATRGLKLYVNGVLSGTAERAVADWHVNGGVQIGRTMWDGAAGTDWWPGLVDEVRLYDRPLTPAEVRAAVGADNVQTGHWKLDEQSGETGGNGVDGGDKLVLRNGAAFTRDRDGDGAPDDSPLGGAVRFDGGDDFAATAGPAVHTNQSFTVAAWVQLDRAPADADPSTALSQDGTYTSAFFLGYRNVANADDRWEVYLPSADTATRPADTVVQSSSKAQLGVPTHLAVVFDDSTRQVQLYVNGTPAGSASHPSGFDATGPLVLGRGLAGGGTPAHFWNGWIDEVRTYSRALSGPELQAVVSRDDVALGEWHLDGTTDSVPVTAGRGTINGDPVWTGGQTDTPDPTDLAIQMNGNDWVSVPHTVDVTHSFSVAAWAKLDQIGGSATVVSQDGSRVSSFTLSALPDGRWAFGMARTDTDGAAFDRVEGPQAQPSVWTHLVGIHDAEADTISLYVNGVEAATAKAHTHNWNYAAGGIQLGGALSNGNRQNRIIGSIDDVAVYGRVLFSDEIRAMAGRDLTLAHNWRLDEGSGTQAADAIGRRTGTFGGGVTRVPGRVGNAVQLNGTDGRIATSGVDIRTDGSFTVSAWVHLDSTCVPPVESECRLTAVSMAGAVGAVGGHDKFQLGQLRNRDQYVDGIWAFEMSEPDGTMRAAVPVLPSDLGRWVHLAGVYDRPSGTLWLYVNGVRKGSATLQTAWNSSAALEIGRGRDSTGTAGQYFQGKVDDVRLYTGGLDDGRINSLYRSYPVQCGTAASPTGCTLPAADSGLWRLDEGTGTAAADSSGRGLAMTLTGGAAWSGGRSGKGLSLDGVDDDARTSGPVVDTTRAFSVGAWVCPKGPTGTDQVVLAQQGSQASPFYVVYDPAGNWTVWVSDQDSASPAVAAFTAPNRVPAGQWVHLGLVYDPSLRQMRLYVSGRLAAARVGVTLWDADGPLTVGSGRRSGAGNHFRGGIDDVRVFGSALTDGQMARVPDDLPAAVHGDWNFDDQTVRDSSWRNNETTAGGMVSYVDGVSGKALSLNGSSASTAGWATSRSAGVPTFASFTVSAWVRLTHEPAVQTAIAQDGGRRSAFALRYQPSLDTWVFGGSTQDADAAEFVYARSRVPVAMGEWTHLTGVYDHPSGQLRIYVNGKLAGTKDGVTMWGAWGGLSIGRDLLNGAPAHYFTGDIDSVRTDLGVVPDTEIAQRAVRP